MRFINTQTLVLQEIADHSVDALENGYAILSHRWREEEITYEDMLNPQPPHHKHGWRKLEDFCAQALRENFHFAWMDTCCINKSSSAELSEAITSMYRWYRDAKKCFTYLDDVMADPEMDSFPTSEWFERGWTLQELLAPSNLSFYDAKWQYLGAKSTHFHLLETVTGIPSEALSGRRTPQSYPIAQRMSWAAERKTTRVEDRAYSLLGLFGVTSLQMNYGEREKAFIRLQEEIIKYSADESIFAWQLDQSREYSGLLASSPADFSGCAHLDKREARPYAFDNMGLSLDLFTRSYGFNTWVAQLNVIEDGCFCGILVSQLPETGQYARVKNSDGQSRLRLSSNLEDYRTRRKIRMRQEARQTPYACFPGFHLRSLHPPPFQDYDVRIVSRGPCTQSDRIRLPEDTPGTVGMVEFVPRQQGAKSDWRQLRWLLFGFDDGADPVCLIANNDSVDVREIFEEADAYFRIPLGTDPSSLQRQESDLFDHQWMSLTGQTPRFNTRWPYGYSVLKGMGESSPSKLGTRSKVRIKFDSLDLAIEIGLEVDPTGPEVPNMLPTVWTVEFSRLGYGYRSLAGPQSGSAAESRLDRLRNIFSYQAGQETVQK